MTFTPADIVAWGTLLGVVLTGIASIISAFRLGKVEHSVNSAATEARAANASLLKQNDMLKEMLAGKDKDAALLAQAVTARSPSRASDPPTPAAADATLSKIERNTDAIAKNTEP